MEIIAKGGVTTPSGFLAGAASCGLKKGSDLDLALLYSTRDCTAAGVFTRNRVVAAPVLLDRETLEEHSHEIRGVVANAGNANACTGAPGLWSARQMQQNAAFALGCRPEQVLVLSTGVIGVQLPMPRVNSGIDAAANRLGEDRGNAMAQAIMTTDTRPKEIAVRVNMGAETVCVGGVAKGSGMIHPDMATMLAVITTDATVPAELVPSLLGDAVAQSFNRISVDGDTSTNDTVLLLCNGESGVVERDQGWETLKEAVDYVCRELAQMIVRDGEGATKFVAIQVSGLESDDAAHQVANTIATSPLVKTALAGSDANWGRILAAAGRAGVPFEQSKSALWVAKPGGRQLQLVNEGTPADYEEAEAAAIFAEQDIDIHLQLGSGDGQATVWTCDLSHDYVSINADYRS
ncbi:MAG: bifunctional glutamate N-acetyltransferase/amino-acid acetyltransferase ArgJ [Chloroflexota bacterium]